MFEIYDEIFQKEKRKQRKKNYCNKNKKSKLSHYKGNTILSTNFHNLVCANDLASFFFFFFLFHFKVMLIILRVIYLKTVLFCLMSRAEYESRHYRFLIIGFSSTSGKNDRLSSRYTFRLSACNYHIGTCKS